MSTFERSVQGCKSWSYPLTRLTRPHLGTFTMSPRPAQSAPPLQWREDCSYDRPGLRVRHGPRQGTNCKIPTAEGDDTKRHPRPLRDWSRLFGKLYLTFRELRQPRQGSFFFMQMLITVAWTLRTGGVYLSEHPALPVDPEAASIWNTPWVRLLCAHPEVALHVVAQCRWGCTVSKSTGLLAVMLPIFAASMYSRQQQGAKAPTEVAIGIGHDGRFKTAAHKEYPMQFCDALAGTLVDHIQHCQRRRLCKDSFALDPDLSEWLCEAAVQRGQVCKAATWLPHYQGR